LGVLLWVIRPLKYLFSAISPHDTPRQLALGLALGIAVGLVPKGNLTAVALTVILFGSRVNLGMGVLAAFCFSWVGTLVDPVSHVIGGAILNRPSIQTLLTPLFDLPLVPWTALNNTVVLGSLLLGVGQFYFSYRVSRPFFEKYQPKVLQQFRRFRPERNPAEHRSPAERRAA
jgi:uncharacterized protein (TIGR03546 family)